MRKKEGHVSALRSARQCPVCRTPAGGRRAPATTPRTAHLGARRCPLRPGSRPAFLYFPTTAMVSLVHTLANGLTGEMGVVGREGVVGVALFMGGASTTSQALIQSAGGGFRLRAAVLHEEFARGGAFHTAAALHPGLADTDCADGGVQPPAFYRTAAVPLAATDAGPRAARRSAHDPRIIGQMLAVRRYITLVAQRLQATGVISYTPRHITIVDRQGLEARV